MIHYIIKRDDHSTQSCPYYKDKTSWCSKWADAEQFDDAVDAEYVRKRIPNKDNKRTYVCEVTVIEKEVVVQAQAIAARQDGPGFTKR